MNDHNPYKRISEQEKRISELRTPPGHPINLNITTKN